MSEIIEGPERSELGKQYDKYQEAIRIGFAQGQASKEASVKEMEEQVRILTNRSNDWKQAAVKADSRCEGLAEKLKVAQGYIESISEGCDDSQDVATEALKKLKG